MHATHQSYPVSIGRDCVTFFPFLLPNFYLFFTDYCAHFESIIKCSWHEENITLNFICWLGGRWDKHNIKYLSNCLYPASRAAAGRGLEHLLVIELTEIALGVERWQHQPPVLRGSVLGSCGETGGSFNKLKPTLWLSLSLFVSGTCLILDCLKWKSVQWCFTFLTLLLPGLWTRCSVKRIDALFFVFYFVFST